MDIIHGLHFYKLQSKTPSRQRVKKVIARPNIFQLQSSTEPADRYRLVLWLDHLKKLTAIVSEKIKYLT